MTTAKLIARARKRADMKPAQLAQAIGVTRSTVHGWEHGTHEPNLDSLRAIAAALECDVASLIGKAA